MRRLGDVRQQRRQQRQLRRECEARVAPLGQAAAAAAVRKRILPVRGILLFLALRPVTQGVHAGG
eukprot:scaffold34252_cov71-Phaeocystis_antarctica.AAC.2